MQANSQAALATLRAYLYHASYATYTEDTTRLDDKPVHLFPVYFPGEPERIQDGEDERFMKEGEDTATTHPEDGDTTTFSQEEEQAWLRSDELSEEQTIRWSLRRFLPQARGALQQSVVQVLEQAGVRCLPLPYPFSDASLVPCRRRRDPLQPSEPRPGYRSLARYPTGTARTAQQA